MPQRIDKACLKCGGACPPEQMKRGRCPKCAEQWGKDEYKNRGIYDPLHEMYQRPGWKRLSKAFKQQNPMCLFIEADGVQCRYPATLVHHRIAAKERPDLFLDPKNLCALCDHHHGHTAGDPAGVNFASAVFKNSLLPGVNLAEPNYSVSAPPASK
jgi:hypothetical protein